jgi:hypothetical protein
LANTIRIKRRATGSPGAPPSLANAELAYNEADHTLYYGEGTGGTGGTATVVVPIGGQGLGSTTVPLMDGSGTAGSASQWARGDHVHPVDTSRAPINSPVFTGSPAGPTVTPGTDSSTKLATPAFVQSAVAAVSAGVTNITAGAGLTGGGTGNVTVAVATNGVTNALAAQMPATTLKGNAGASAANAADLTPAQAISLLGLGTMATQNAGAVAITGGTIDGIVLDGGVF